MLQKINFLDRDDNNIENETVSNAFFRHFNITEITMEKSLFFRQYVLRVSLLYKMAVKRQSYFLIVKK